VVDPAPLLGRWKKDVDAVTVTSGELLDNLIALLQRHGRLFNTLLVVISPRIAELAAGRGFRKVVTAAGPGERAIVTALCTLGPLSRG
jgi:uroporphyrinogen-III synthase